MASAHVKVSVLIPTYNYARYLPEAIESVLGQSFGDFELLISDDASSDDSAEIIRKYAARDRRIRFVVQTPNIGMVRNWNWCLEQAAGTLIKYVFGDDFLLQRDSLAKLVEMIESRPDITLASSARTIVDEESRPLHVMDDFGASGIYDGRDAISWSLRSNCNVFGEPSVVLFKKEHAKRGFDSRYAQILDWEMWIHLLQQGQLAYTQEPLCAFRRHSMQQTEVNRRSVGSGHEHPKLISQYADYLCVLPQDRRELFERAWFMRQWRDIPQHDLEVARIFEQSLGLTYHWEWLRFKMSRRAHSLRRSWVKHVLRREPPKRRLIVRRTRPLQIDTASLWRRTPSP